MSYVPARFSASNPGPRARAFGLADGIVHELAEIDPDALNGDSRQSHDALEVLRRLIRRARAVRDELDRTQR